MSNYITIKSTKRKQLDEDKLALAFLLLAKILDEEVAAGRHDSASQTGAEVA